MKNLEIFLFHYNGFFVEIMLLSVHESSAILPAYLALTIHLEALVPWTEFFLFVHLC